eukprot:471238-Pyramimonas_sp.AAC.1
MEGGPLPECGSRLWRRARSRNKHVQELRGLRAVPFQAVALAAEPRTLALQICSSVTEAHGECGRHGVLEPFGVVKSAVASIRSVEVPGIAFWHGAGSSTRNLQVDSWRWNPES